MALTSLLLLVALASSAIAQDTSMSPIVPDPTTTTTMMPMTTTQMPMQTPAPAPLFENVSAEAVQRDHFFCLGEGSTRSMFLTTPSGSLMDSDWPFRWGIWIQYPVLSYLDTMRKRHLFYVISRMVNSGNTVVGDLFNRICVAEVEQYEVSTFRESVFVKLYVNESIDEGTLQSIDTAFRAAFVPNGPYTRPFLERTAINISATNPSVGRTLADKTVNDSVHPGCDMDSCPEGDPTLLPIVIGTYVGRAYYGTYTSGEPPEEVTISTLERLERNADATIGRFYRLNQFASNPRPINYGLEAGDIVFAVFGSIFLTILAGAIILGFVIHPFFLA